LELLHVQLLLLVLLLLLLLVVVVVVMVLQVLVAARRRSGGAVVTATMGRLDVRAKSEHGAVRIGFAVGAHAARSTTVRRVGQGHGPGGATIALLVRSQAPVVRERQLALGASVSDRSPAVDGVTFGRQFGGWHGGRHFDHGRLVWPHCPASIGDGLNHRLVELEHAHRSSRRAGMLLLLLMFLRASGRCHSARRRIVVVVVVVDGGGGCCCRCCCCRSAHTVCRGHCGARDASSCNDIHGIRIPCSRLG